MSTRWLDSRFVSVLSVALGRVSRFAFRSRGAARAPTYTELAVVRGSFPIPSYTAQANEYHESCVILHRHYHSVTTTSPLPPPACLFVSTTRSRCVSMEPRLTIPIVPLLLSTTRSLRSNHPNGACSRHVLRDWYWLQCLGSIQKRWKGERPHRCCIAWYRICHFAGTNPLTRSISPPLSYFPPTANPIERRRIR